MRKNMDNWKFYGLILALACIMIFTPVSACHPVLTKTGPKTECPTCEYFEYTITARASDPVAGLRVQDTLPSGLTFVSSTPPPTQQAGQTLTWIFTTDLLSTKTITVRVQPTSPSVLSVSNYVSGKIMRIGSGSWTDYRDTSSNPVVTRFSYEICPPEIPEFPSIFTPAIMAIGFLGAVFCIKRTREN